MKMTRLALLPLLLFLFFGCTENKKAETISYKDIEGYWVSGYLLHNTDLSRSIAAGNAEKEQGIQLLRLKNEVNGFADTSYRLKGNELIYRTNLAHVGFSDSLHHNGESWDLFLITFHSKDRLILKDVRTSEEITYYNLSMIPEGNERFSEIKFKEDLIVNDSVRLGYKIFDKVIPVNEEWKNDLNRITERINWKGGLFIRNACTAKLERIGEFNFFESGEPIHFKIITTKHSGEWILEGNAVSDPALSLLIREMKVLDIYCYLHGIVKPVNIL